MQIFIWVYLKMTGRSARNTTAIILLAIMVPCFVYNLSSSDFKSPARTSPLSNQHTCQLKQKGASYYLTPDEYFMEKTLHVILFSSFFLAFIVIPKESALQPFDWSRRYRRSGYKIKTDLDKLKLWQAGLFLAVSLPFFFALHFYGLEIAHEAREWLQYSC